LVKYPFHKLLLYLATLSKFDRYRFSEKLDLYLPSIIFDVHPIEYVQEHLKEKLVPTCVYAGSADPSAMRLYCQINHLGPLHGVFNTAEFEDLIYDLELRRKIDAMILSPAFRTADIMREFPKTDKVCLDVYTDCVANFASVSNKHAYLACVGDERERKLLTKMMTVTSRETLRLVLGLKCADMNPVEIMNKSLTIAALKTDDALLNDDNQGLERWVKLQASLAERMHGMGVGTRTDLDELLTALKVEPVYCDPVIYTKEQLEGMYQERQPKTE